MAWPVSNDIISVFLIFRYPEVTPKHELNEEGQPAFHIHTSKAAEHLYGIIDGKPKEVLGTTYARIKEIVMAVHECGYFDKVVETITEVEVSSVIVNEEEVPDPIEDEVGIEQANAFPPAGALPVPPAPAVVPTPAYPLRPLPPITLQEVEHAYFSQQYPQQRPITEVIGSQNFFFLQESEIDSPVGTPQPPQIPNQPSPPAQIPTQTFTNQHFVQLPGGRVGESAPMPMPPQPHFPPHTDHTFAPAAGVPMPTPVPHPAHVVIPTVSSAAPPTVVADRQPMSSSVSATANVHPSTPVHTPVNVHTSTSAVQSEQRSPATPAEDKNDEDWKESRSPDNEDGIERKTQGQGDGQNRFRRYGRGGSRGAPNGHRGRGAFPSRQSSDGYRGRHGGEYQNRSNKDNYQNRQYDGYHNRHKDGYQNRTGDDGYYGNGDAGDHRDNENSGRDRYNDNAQSYQGGFKSRGRGGTRGGSRGAPRAPRSHQYNRKPENVE